MRHYLQAMSRYAVFRGRASRSEFWYFTLVYIVLGAILALIDDGLDGGQPGPGPLSFLWTAVHVLPALAVTVRRLHDIDRSGWWVLLNLTGIGALVVLVFAVTESMVGPNRFGPAPVEPGQPAHEHDAASSGVNTAAPGSPAAASRAMASHAAIAAPPAPYASSADIIGDLERLAQLRAAGGLSDAEFETMKARTLAKAVAD